MSAPSETQVVFVGSGINSLVGAALLAVRGKRVLVLERNDRLGGCIRTEELFPGYRHEVFSSWHPLFVGSPAMPNSSPSWNRPGWKCCAATIRPAWSGRTAGAWRSGRTWPTPPGAWTRSPGDGQALQDMAARMFGEDAALTFGLLGKNPYSWDLLKLLYSEWRKRGLDGMTAFAAGALENFRRWSERTLRSDAARADRALDPAFRPGAGRCRFGADRQADLRRRGQRRHARDQGRRQPAGRGAGPRHRESRRPAADQRAGGPRAGRGPGRRARAAGVQLADGRRVRARDAVVCNVTPQQLYGQLLPDAPPPARAQAYRYGRGCMQLHFALNAPPAWMEPELVKVPLVHLTESLEQVCASVTEANNGLLPARPTLAIGQPVAVDPSRAPEGGWILWIQMQEMPARLKGDAAGQIDTPADGRWNEAVREAYADRVQARLERVMPGLAERIVGRRACSPADLETLNCNLVGGDPYSGICSPDQFFWLRPFASQRRRRTVAGLYHIARPPTGPGLGAGSARWSPGRSRRRATFRRGIRPRAGRPRAPSAHRGRRAPRQPVAVPTTTHRG